MSFTSNHCSTLQSSASYETYQFLHDFPLIVKPQVPSWVLGRGRCWKLINLVSRECIKWQPFCFYPEIYTDKEQYPSKNREIGSNVTHFWIVSENSPNCHKWNPKTFETWQIIIIQFLNANTFTHHFHLFCFLMDALSFWHLQRRPHRFWTLITDEKYVFFLLYTLQKHLVTFWKYQ